MKIDLYVQSGEKKGTTEASDAMFKVVVNDELIRLSVIRQLANRRQANAHVKTRAEVRGGGKKPWRQKGTGRARFGSSRNPVWRGGGVAFGPRNVRNFSLDMPKKARRSALFSCLSQKAADNRIFALDTYKADTPKTGDFSAMVEKLPAGRSLLIVLDAKNEILEKSANNLPKVKTILVDYLNPHDILTYDNIMFMKPALKKAEEIFLK
ncbi:50S ribosomal protein L4 [Patescibacteria group bacterium]|nr:50S ribosomal protein L4 [Patescibacteria group bacterium]MBU1016427.1 50S ribosomal protein L4 [Patescibacteria group bacterium]MBU1684925.1 50S ribosomal protein L4 [Patescibacteria group bacterium]MBU1939047.1 50S ribosomal protein L4 [Patescibacteria group bacterium]